MHSQTNIVCIMLSTSIIQIGVMHNYIQTGINLIILPLHKGRLGKVLHKA